MIRLEIPNPVPPRSVNKIGRQNYWVQHNNSKPWRHTTELVCRSWKHSHTDAWRRHVRIPARVQTIIGVNASRRRDPANFMPTVVKPIVDGLVDAGLWPDDTPDWVRESLPTFAIADRTLVLIHPRWHVAPEDVPQCWQCHRPETMWMDLHSCEGQWFCPDCCPDCNREGGAT